MKLNKKQLLQRKRQEKAYNKRLILNIDLSWEKLRNDPQIKESVAQIIKVFLQQNFKNLCQMFDLDSLQIYNEYTCDINISGKRQWFKPTFAASIDIKGQKINEGSDIIVYHGIRKNEALNPILQQGLKPGKGQAYKDKQDYTRQGTIPQGIYVSQFMNSTLKYTDYQNPMVLQCAARDIYLTKRKDYLVSTFVRPVRLVFPFSHAPREELQ